MKKKVLTLGSIEIDAINKSDIYDTFKNLYLSEKNTKRTCGEGAYLRGFNPVD